MCSGGRRDYGALKAFTVRHKLRRQQGSATLFSLCVRVWCSPSSSSYIWYIYKYRSCCWESSADDLQRFSPPPPPLFSLPFRSPPPPHFCLAFTLGSSSRGERRTKKKKQPPPLRTPPPLENLIYILFLCQKYWHQLWHHIPEQQSAASASPRFHQPSFFIGGEGCWKEGCGLKSSLHCCCCCCPTSLHRPLCQGFVLYALWINKMWFNAPIKYYWDLQNLMCLFHLKSWKELHERACFQLQEETRWLNSCTVGVKLTVIGFVKQWWQLVARCWAKVGQVGVLEGNASTWWIEVQVTGAGHRKQETIGRMLKTIIQCLTSVF